jgi:hypothetical protein
MKRGFDSRGGNSATTELWAVFAQPGVRVRVIALSSLALLTSFALLATPAFAAKTTSKTAKPRFSIDTPLTSFQSPIADAGKFSFTASGSSAASAGIQTVERAFRFTPSGQSDNRKALSLGVNTRVIAAAADHSRAAPPVETMAALPTSYNVDLSVAWKGFAVNTGIGHVETGPAALLLGRRDTIDLGVSYRGRNWKTSLQGTAEKGGLLAFAPLERRYSVELGGAYAIAPRVSVNGGVRYKLAPLEPSLLDADRADQTVYLGTNVAF